MFMFNNLKIKYTIIIKTYMIKVTHKDILNYCSIVTHKETTISNKDYHL